MSTALPLPSAPELARFLALAIADLDRAFPGEEPPSTHFAVSSIIPYCVKCIFPETTLGRVFVRWETPEGAKDGAVSSNIVLHDGQVLSARGLRELKDVKNEVLEGEVRIWTTTAYPDGKSRSNAVAVAELDLDISEVAATTGSWPEVLLDRLAFYRAQWQATHEAEMLEATSLPSSAAPGPHRI